MPIQIGDDPPPPPTLAERLAPWLRRILIGGCLIWICFSVQTSFEDTRSHTIKVTYPLLMNYEKISAPQPAFDPRNAVWVPVKTAFLVPDGAILFVKTGETTYAIKLLHQTIKPEQSDYEYLKVGSTEPAVKGTAQTLPGGIALPGQTIAWSARSDGAGYLYLDDAYIWNKPSRYTVGVPFQSGGLEHFRQAIPPNVHFESVPWKIEDAAAAEIAPPR